MSIMNEALDRICAPDRRAYRSPKDRAIDAIRCLRMAPEGAKDMREIVSALQAHAGHVLAGERPERIAEVAGHLNDAAIALLDMDSMA